MKSRLPAVALLFGVVAVFADEQSKEFKPLIITATRTEQRLDAALASTTVITREDIERRQAATFQDVLRGVPGVGIANSGGLGKATSAFIRGTESDHVLILIDGLRVGSATSGGAAFQDIPIDQIDRIEIVRGPRSSLYGSEAIGGVIQIFTRRGEGDLRPTFSVGGGSHRTYKVSGGVSGSIGNAWYSFNASRIDSEGFNSCRGLPFPPGGGCFTFEGDPDGYTNNSGSARAGYRFDETLEVEGHFLHIEGDNEFDGSISNESEIKQQVVGGTLRYSPFDLWDITISGGRHLDESDNFLRPKMSDTQRVFSSRFDTERRSVTVQNDVSITADQIITLGFDYYNDEISSTESFDEDSRDNKGGFAQYQGSFGANDWVFGVRYDDNEQFGGEVTGNAAWGYTFGDTLRLTAGVGSAFKAPSFNELYFPGFGNPDLDPEKSISFELGANGQMAGVRWSLSGYYTRLDELIIPVFSLVECAPPFFFCAQNVDEAQVLGLEATASATLWGWDVAANLTLIDPENRGDEGNKGNVLPRRAQQMFQIDLDRRINWVSGGISVYGEGRKFDDLANNERLGGFVLADVRVAFYLPQDFVLEGRVSNVFDKDYETAGLFNQDGRNFFFTLRYTP